MATLDDLLQFLQSWKQPPGGEHPFKLACRIDPGATPAEIENAFRGANLPDELIELWSGTRESWLFEDIDYGQWGLHLLNPRDSASRTAAEQADRPDEVRSDDVVLGEFLGDQELLIYAPSEANGHRVLIAHPLDPRGDWYAVGGSVTDVLGHLLAAGGEKYWESAPSRDDASPKRPRLGCPDPLER